MNKTDRDKHLDAFREGIGKFDSQIWRPSKDLPGQSFQFSWYGCNQSVNTELERYIPFDLGKKTFPSKVMTCKRVKISPTPDQKVILISWFDACRKMYNATIAKIRHLFKVEGRTVTSWMTLRTKYLKKEKEQIITTSLKFGKKNVPAHIIDNSIKHACTAYKSALSNLKGSNIKHFRLRYRSKGSKSFTMEVEKSCFNKSNLFGQLKASYDGEPFDLFSVKNNANLKYDKRENTFILFVPIEIQSESLPERSPVIALDPGVRTFMTGIGSGEVFEFGKGCTERLKQLHLKIDKIEGRKFPNKKRVLMKCRRKIRNLVSEMHWTVIDFLTKHYDNIVVGNISSQKIISNESSTLSNMTKRLSSSLSFYLFSQRLASKCQQRQVKFSLIDESYTSKICSCCGWENRELKGSKTFDCLGCGVSLDRDVNGARGILIKAFDPQFRV